MSRERAEGRGLFWPARCGGALGAAVVVVLVAFLGGASGAGHSTSCVRSSRLRGTHSKDWSVGVTKRVAELMAAGQGPYHLDVY